MATPNRSFGFHIRVHTQHRSELKGYRAYKEHFPCALKLFLAHLGFKD